MNCEECLVELETMSTNDVGGSAVALHSATCRECARVLQAITQADRLMMQERDETYSTVPTEQVARRAVLLGQRRRAFGGITFASIVLVVLSVWYSVEMLDRPSGPDEVFYAGPLETESFELRCLSADNITPLLGPYTQSRGSEITRTMPPLRVITVRTTAHEMEKVRGVLKRFDVPVNGACAVNPSEGSRVPADMPPAAAVPPPTR